MSDLLGKRCLPCEGEDLKPLDGDAIARLLGQLAGWRVNERGELERDFEFTSYHHVIAFVNAIAWIAHTENHHPDLEVSYAKVKVRYATHYLGALSENDFICAAKVDALVAGGRVPLY